MKELINDFDERILRLENDNQKLRAYIQVLFDKIEVLEKDSHVQIKFGGGGGC